MHKKSPLLVLAGVGTGKTETLMIKYAYLILRGCDPNNILGVTFTNKAAIEMQERAVQKLEFEKGSLKGAWVNTFHSLSCRILREDENYRNVGLYADYHILTSEDSNKCHKELFRDNKEVFDKIMDIERNLNYEKHRNIEIKKPPYSKITKAIDKFKNLSIHEGFENFDEEMFDEFEIEVFRSIYTPY